MEITIKLKKEYLSETNNGMYYLQHKGFATIIGLEDFTTILGDDKHIVVYFDDMNHKELLGLLFEHIKDAEIV